MDTKQANTIANWDYQPYSKYKIDDEIYVNKKHFVSKKSIKLLHQKNAGFWKISRIIDNKTYKLEISQHIKNADFTIIFHLWKLYLASNNLFSDQVLPLKSLILIQDNKKIYNK